jgi:hypothetical protein
LIDQLPVLQGPASFSKHGQGLTAALADCKRRQIFLPIKKALTLLLKTGLLQKGFHSRANRTIQRR